MITARITGLGRARPTLLTDAIAAGIANRGPLAPAVLPDGEPAAGGTGPAPAAGISTGNGSGQAAKPAAFQPVIAILRLRS